MADETTESNVKVAENIKLRSKFKKKKKEVVKHQATALRKAEPTADKTKHLLQSKQWPTLSLGMKG